MKKKFICSLCICSIVCLISISSHAQSFRISSKGASSINKANALLKIDDAWGANRWYGEFMYNNANFKIKDLVLLAGEHTLIVRPGKGLPVLITFVGEDQKEYEIVEHNDEVKIYCTSDKTYVATAVSALYKENEKVSVNSNSTFEQALKVKLDKIKANIRIYTIDGFLGEERLHYGGYTFPDQDGITKIKLAPGKHTLEFALNTKSRFSAPVRLDFETEEHKTYTLKIELHKKKGTDFFQFGKDYYFSAEVVELDN